LAGLAEEFGLRPDERLESEAAFLELKARVDLRVARLYGLRPADLLRLLGSFRVLREKSPQFAETLQRLAKGKEAFLAQE
jgi:hypothetical protein